MSGETVYRVRVTARGAEGLDNLTQAAQLARESLRSLNKVGGAESARALAGGMLEAARAAKAQAQAAQASAAATAAKVAGELDAVRLAEAQMKASQREATAARRAEAEAARAAKQEAKELADAAKAAGVAKRDWSQASSMASAGLKGVGSAVAFAANVTVDLISKAKDAATALISLATEGAKLQTLKGAFESLGGSAKEMEKLRELTGGLVSDSDLMQATNLAKLFKLPEAEVPKLIKLAQGASAALGTTVGKALNDTFTAASRQSKMIADNMGIVIGDMTKMYEAFAAKLGKTAGQLTDQEKSLAFTQKMIAEGGRQMELATVAQGNAAMRAAAGWDNFTDSIKVGVAEMFGKMGIWDALGETLGTVKRMFEANAGSISSLLGPAFKNLIGLVPPLLKIFMSLVPILEPLAQYLKLVATAAGGMAPTFVTVIGVVSKLAMIVLDLMTYALGPMLETTGAVVGLFDSKMGDALAKSGKAMQDARVYIDANTDALKAQAGAANDVAEALGNMTSKNVMTGEAGAMQKALLADAAEAMKTAELTGRSMTRAQFEGMAREQAGAMAQFLAANRGKMTALAAETAAQFADRGGDGMKEAARKMALAFLESSGAEKDKFGQFSKAQLESTQKAFEAAGALIVAEDKRTKDELRKADEAALRQRERMQADSAAFGTNILAETMMQGVDKEADALAKLEAYHDEHADRIARLFEGDSDALERAESALAELVDKAGVEIRKHRFKGEKADKKPGKGIDWAKRDYDVRLALATDHERSVMEVERRYGEMAKNLRKDDTVSRLALAERMNKDLLKIEQDRGRAQLDAKRTVNMSLMSEERAAHEQALIDIQKRAQELRDAAKVAGIEGEATPAINAQEQAALSRQKMKPILDLRDKFKGIGGSIADSLGSTYADTMAAMEEETKKRTANMAQLFQGMGLAVGNTFISMAAAGQSSREEVMRNMGQLFGQLSAAFLAWAQAEGGLLAGNPVAAAGAAIALGLVASAISAFSSRKSSGGGGGKSVSRRSLEDEADRRGQQKQQAPVINVYGFATPDSISGSARRGNLRGNELNGRGVA